MENEQNAPILHDICSKNTFFPEFWRAVLRSNAESELIQPTGCHANKIIIRADSTPTPTTSSDMLALYKLVSYYYYMAQDIVVRAQSYYTVSGKKKGTNSILGITSSNTGRFLKFFQCHNLLEICNKSVIKFPTTPQKRRYTTL